MNNNKESNNYNRNKEKLNYQKINRKVEHNNNNRKLAKNNSKDLFIKNPYYEREKSAYIISKNNNSSEKNKNIKMNDHEFIKSEDNNRNKVAKTKIYHINNKRDNSTRRVDHREHNSTSINTRRNNNLRGNSLNKKFNNYDFKGPISYIYANMNNSLLNNNLINSYNKEYSNDLNILNKYNNDNNKNYKYKKNFKSIYKNEYINDICNSQILTDINDNKAYKNKNENENKRLISEKIYSPEHNNKDYNESNFQNKKVSQPKYSLKDINIRNNYDNNNNRLYDNRNNIIEKVIKRGRSSRQKNSISEIIPKEIAF